MKITVFDGKNTVELPFCEGETILSVLQNGGIQNISAPCGGKGTCKKCEVYVRGKDFCGPCLSCQTLAEDGMAVEIETVKRISFAEESAAAVCAPTPGQSGYAMACDIGTTTVVCQLLNLATGEVVAGVSGSNRMCMFGSNVLSLLDAASEGHADEIHDLVISQINENIRLLCAENDLTPEQIKQMAVTGNTIMMHFLAGLNPAEISIAPFTPVSLFGEMQDGRKLGLEFEVPVYLCPSASGFIGSDVICGMLACGMEESEKPVILLDIGTNTEMVLGSKNGFSACSADGGAVFKASLLEHGMTASVGAISGAHYQGGTLSLEVLGNCEAKGVCGSGFIDILGIMYENDVLDEIGHIADPDDVDEEIAKYIGEEDDRPVFYLTEDRKLFISEADISKFQLAKAAVYAGLHVLLKEQGTTLNDVGKLYLCGGFGSFGHRRHSALLGIIPQECKGKTVKMGNTALIGAISAAISEESREKLSEIQKAIQIIDLPKHKDFNNLYMDGMIFE